MLLLSRYCHNTNTHRYGDLVDASRAKETLEHNTSSLGDWGL